MILVRPVLVLVDESMPGCEFDEKDVEVFPTTTGLRELRGMVQQGQLRLGNRAIVINFLGAADVYRGRRFSTVLERFIQACKLLAPETYIVMAGPFPRWGDAPHLLERLFRERFYTHPNSIVTFQMM